MRTAKTLIAGRTLILFVLSCRGSFSERIPKFPIMTRNGSRSFNTPKAILDNPLMIKSFEKKYVLEKIQVVDFLELALSCSMINSGAWYAFHTIAYMDLCLSFVAIETVGSELGIMVTS